MPNSGFDTNSVLLDSLPYIDRELEIDGMKDTVDKLIREEMRRLVKPDYSNVLPPKFELFKNSLLLANEIERVDSRKPMPPIDLSRYQLPAPSDEEKDSAESWKKAYENSLAQLEQQKNRLMNLELLQKYGNNAWLYHNFQLEKHLSIVQKALDQAKSDIVEINKSRKASQLQTASTLSALQTRYTELLNNVVQVDAACAGLEAEIETLRGVKAKLEGNADVDGMNHA